jgi:hypothetical protein
MDVRLGLSEGRWSRRTGDFRPSILFGRLPSLGKKEAAMYDDGFIVALVIGVLALLAPALWIAWWYVADVSEGVSGRTRPRAV